VAAWALAWNRWGRRPWRTLDAAALAVMAAQIAAAMLHSAGAARAGRLAAIALFVVHAARIVHGAAPRVLALATLVLTVLAFFGGELLDPLEVPGIWFPLGIGVSRTQFLYAIFIPLFGFLIVRTLAPRPRTPST